MQTRIKKIVQPSTQTHSSSIERPVCSSSNTGPQRQTSVLADMEVWRPGVSDSSSRRGLRLGTPCRDRGGICETRVSTQRSHPRKGDLLRRLHEEVAATVHPVPTRRVCTPCRRLWTSLGQIQNLPWPDSSTASLALSPFPLAPHGCFLTAALDALVECV